MAAPTSQTAPPLEQAALEQQVTIIVQELLREQGKGRLAEKISPQSSFERDLGLASLDLVELVVRCETRLEVELPDEIAEQEDTAAGWAKAILQGGQEGSARSEYRILPPTGDAPAWPEKAATLVDVLRWHAERVPGRVHVHMIERGAGQGITCPQILESAEAVARGLISQGVKRDDRIAILLPNSFDFFAAFFGVEMAGAVPVPLYAPAPRIDLVDYVKGQARLLKSTAARGLITFDKLRPLARLLRARTPHMLGAFTVASLARMGRRASARLPDPSAIAFIQLTSGSTGEPKAIALSHRHLLSNIRAIGKALQVRGDDAVVSWLPLASDLGLAGCWLFSLYHATPLTQMSPLEFSERPESWLWAIHDSRATLSAAPNFAYELCARRIPMWTTEGLDLSCWRAAVNAGELVRRETVERFSRRFQVAGFRAEAMTPGYGLAEAGVALSLSPAGRGPVWDEDGFASTGCTVDGIEARVCEERLEFRSSDAKDDAWTETGDRARIRDGEIFVRGRDKDVIVRSGRVLAPEFLEAAIGSVAGIRAGAVAAIGVPDAARGTERLVIIAESEADTDWDRARVVRAAEVAIRAAAGEEADEVCLIAPRTLPLTYNGKLRRSRARELYESGKLGHAAGPLWSQKLSLWRSNAFALTAMSLARTGRILAGTLRSMAAEALARTGGALIRLTGARGIAAPASRLALKALGQQFAVAGAVPAGSLLVTNRCGSYDPMILAAAIAAPVRFSGPEALLATPDWAAYLLGPLVLRSDAERTAALAEGVVAQLPDSPAGTAAERCRYRLGPLKTAPRVVPAALYESQRKTTLRPGEALPAQSPEGLRRELRAAIAKLHA